MGSTQTVAQVETHISTDFENDFKRKNSNTFINRIGI